MQLGLVGSGAGCTYYCPVSLLCALLGVRVCASVRVGLWAWI